MNSIRIWPLLILAIMGLSSCAGPGGGTLTCAPVGLRNGKAVPLSSAEFNRVEPMLSGYLAPRGYVLVSDVITADRVATIKYEPDAVTPGVGALKVLDISPNPYKPPVRNVRSSELPIPVSASADGEVNREKVGFPTDWRRD